jgi:hypothetical protein
MFTTIIPLLIAALDCAEFEARAYVLDATWEQTSHHEEALLLLSLYPNYVAQVDLLLHLDRRGHLELLPRERARLIALSQRSAPIESLFREYHALASALLSRAARTPSRR